jgi:hypothetical protein
MAYNSNQKDKSHENRFNSTFSREPVYGEGITTNYERGHDLRNLQESLEKGSLSLVGASLIGNEVPEEAQALIKFLNEQEQLGASVFCGESIELITEDGGLLVIGDDCVIYNSKIRVAKGATLLLEAATILGCDIEVKVGEHRIIGSNLSRCTVTNSTLHDIEAKESTIDGSLVRDAHFLNSTLKQCIGTAGGCEIGGIFIGKSFSYFFDLNQYLTWVKVEDIKELKAVYDAEQELQD